MQCLKLGPYILHSPCTVHMVDEPRCSTTAVFSPETANQVVLRCKLVLVNALYGLGQVLISLVVL